MSHLLGLEEFTDEQLENELKRRQDLRAMGKCSYCKHSLDTEAHKSQLRCRLHEKRIGMIGHKVIVQRVGS